MYVSVKIYNNPHVKILTKNADNAKDWFSGLWSWWQGTGTGNKGEGKGKVTVKVCKLPTEHAHAKGFLKIYYFLRLHPSYIS